MKHSGRNRARKSCQRIEVQPSALKLAATARKTHAPVSTVQKNESGLSCCWAGPRSRRRLSGRRPPPPPRPPRTPASAPRPAMPSAASGPQGAAPATPASLREGGPAAAGAPPRHSTRPWSKAWPTCTRETADSISSTTRTQRVESCTRECHAMKRPNGGRAARGTNGFSSVRAMSSRQRPHSRVMDLGLDRSMSSRHSWPSSAAAWRAQKHARRSSPQ
mmetsp:Transcript_15429/g.49373  ORF Transcript_15429/g.49373 Transcript_15429/m.49373 type:complete len:219 (-) Transcript_15429:409-1065(-)